VVTQPRVIEADEAGVPNADICAFYATQWARPIALSRPDFCDWQMNAAPGARGATGPSWRWRGTGSSR